jgi:hypothetical protein
MILIAILLFLSVKKEEKKTTLPVKSATQITTHQTPQQTIPVREEIVTQPAPPLPVAAAEAAGLAAQPAPAATAEPATKPISEEVAPPVEKKSSAIPLTPINGINTFTEFVAKSEKRISKVLITADKSPKKNSSIPLLTPRPVTKNNGILSKAENQPQPPAPSKKTDHQ